VAQSLESHVKLTPISENILNQTEPLKVFEFLNGKDNEKSDSKNQERAENEALRPVDHVLLTEVLGIVARSQLADGKEYLGKVFSQMAARKTAYNLGVRALSKSDPATDAAYES